MISFNLPNITTFYERTVTSLKVFFSWKQISEAMDYVDKGGSIQNALSLLTKRYKLSSIQHRQINGILLETYRRLNTIDRLIKINIPNQSIIKLPPLIRAKSRVTAYLRLFKPESQLTKHILSTIKRDKKHPAIRAALERELEEVYSLATSEYEEIGYKYFFPPWMVSLFIETYGKKNSIKIMEALNQPPLTFFRTNPFKIKEEKVIHELSRKSFKSEKIPQFPFFYKLISGPRGLPSTEEFKNGLIIIQDLASARAALVAAKVTPENGTVFDMCSAPGSKLTYFKTLKPSTITIASEFNHKRINILNHRLDTIKISPIHLVQNDSRSLPLHKKVKFDTIMLDPPCTGIGTIGSHPEIKWRLKKRAIRWYVKNQYSFLKQAVKHVKPNGHIVYSTCTLTNQENIDLIQKILSEEKSIELSETIPEPSLGYPVKEINGTELILPYYQKTEGFFIALLKKRVS